MQGRDGAATAEPGVRARGSRLTARGSGLSLFLAPGLALYGLFVLWPLVQVCRLALYHWNGYGAQTFVGLKNFDSLLNDPLFGASLQHTVLWEGAAIVALPIAGLGIALLLERSRARALFLTSLFFPALLPATVVAAVWVLIYSPVSGPLAGRAGLPRDWLGDPRLALLALFLAWAWSAVGMGALIFWAGLKTIGREYVEIALVEGAGPIWRLWHVTLPTLHRTGAVVLLLDAALAVQVFDLVFVTTGGGPGYATMLVPLDAYGRAFGGRTGEGAAAACAQVALGVALAVLALILLRRRDVGMIGGAEEELEVEPGRVTWLSTGVLASLLALLLLPLGWLALAAFAPARSFALGAAFPGTDPRYWAWSNFGAVWNAGMAGATGTSALLAAAVVAGTLALAGPAAFALAQLSQIRVWPTISLPLLLVGLLQPTPVLIIPLFSLLKNLGLLDTAWGVILPEIARAFPLGVLLMWAFLAQSSREVLEAAEIDGASAFQRMLWVALPLARPALYAVAVWSFVTSWNEYLLPTLVSQDGSVQTVPTLLATFIGTYNTQYGLLAAGSLMAIVPSLAIYLVLRRPAGRGIAGVERRVS